MHNQEQKDDNKPQKELKVTHKAIIDEYYNNGFNGVKAARTVKGNDLAYNTASSSYLRAMKDPKSKAYIAKKQQELKANADIKQNQILKELINLAYSDVTDYIQLSAEELKDLPPEVRRCIASIQRKTRTFTDRKGKEIKEETYNIKLVDKLRSIDLINKHIGFYLEDNKQKQTKINIEQLNVNTLNALLAATNTNNE